MRMRSHIRGPSRAAIITGLTASLLVAACSGDGEEGTASPYRVYQDAEEMTLAMNHAGFRCETVEVSGPEDLADVEGAVSMVSCGLAATDYPNSYNPTSGTELNLQVFDSESARVTWATVIFVWACEAAEPYPDSVAHAYGPNWAIQDNYGSGDLDYMERLASALGGLASTTSCAQLGELLDEFRSVGTDLESLSPSDIAQLKIVLGEVDFPGVDLARFPQAPPPPA
jgi:hypothetical protein